MGQHKHNPNAAAKASGGFSGQSVEEVPIRTNYGVTNIGGRNVVVLQWNRALDNWLLTVEQVDETVKFLLEAKAVAEKANRELPAGQGPKPS